MKCFVGAVILCLGLAGAALAAPLSPRPEGSAAELQELGHLAGELDKAKVPYTRESYSNLAHSHSFAYSLVASIAGKSPDRLVLVVPVDTSAAKNAQTGLSWGLEVCRKWAKVAPPLSLTVFFAGAERNTGTRTPLSSLQFLENFFPSEPAAVLILDVDESSGSLELVPVSGASITPLWLLKSWLEAFRSAGFAVQLAGSQPQIFRFDIPEKRTLAQPWFNRGFSTLLVQNSPSSQTRDTRQDFLVSLTNFMNQYSRGLPSSGDRNYIVFDAGWGAFFLPQGYYLGALLLTAFLLTLLFLVRAPKRGIDLASWRASAWQIPVSFFFLFLFLVLATSILNSLFVLRNFTSFWRYEPLPTLALKLSLTLSLYFLFFFQFRRLPLSRWSKFYSYSALFVLALETLSAAAIELSFSFYFLWALVFAVLFHLTPRRGLKILFFALAPLWFVKAVAEIFWLYPDPILTRLILISTPVGNLGFSLLLFPFLLLAHSFHYQRHQRQERNEKHRIRVLMMFWTALSAALVLLVLDLNPFQKVQAPLNWNETMNLNTRQDDLVVSSPILWDRLGARLDGRPITIPAHRQRANLALPFQGDIVETRLTSRAFLDRTVWSLNIRTFGQASNLQILLNADNPVVVYDCNFPFQLENASKRVRIFIGANPPQNLDLRMTLAQDARAQLDLDFDFSPSPHVVQLRTERFQVRSTLRVHDKIRLKP
ncbi:MAG: hypothetical protein HKM06_01815 [Spirochaetales bacterium]|nr:hypothetical protein [Spirochaetales bacterium]